MNVSKTASVFVQNSIISIRADTGKSLVGSDRGEKGLLRGCSGAEFGNSNEIFSSKSRAVWWFALAGVAAAPQTKKQQQQTTCLEQSHAMSRQLILALLLRGGIEPNPGPPKVQDHFADQLTAVMQMLQKLTGAYEKSKQSGKVQSTTPQTVNATSSASSRPATYAAAAATRPNLPQPAAQKIVCRDWCRGACSRVPCPWVHGSVSPAQNVPAPTQSVAVSSPKRPRDEQKPRHAKRRERRVQLRQSKQNQNNSSTKNTPVIVARAETTVAVQTPVVAARTKPQPKVAAPTTAAPVPHVHDLSDDLQCENQCAALWQSYVQGIITMHQAHTQKLNKLKANYLRQVRLGIYVCGSPSCSFSARVESAVIAHQIRAHPLDPRNIYPPTRVFAAASGLSLPLPNLGRSCALTAAVAIVQRVSYTLDKDKTQQPLQDAAYHPTRKTASILANSGRPIGTRWDGIREGRCVGNLLDSLCSSSHGLQMCRVRISTRTTCSTCGTDISNEVPSPNFLSVASSVVGSPLLMSSIGSCLPRNQSFTSCEDCGNQCQIQECIAAEDFLLVELDPVGCGVDSLADTDIPSVFAEEPRYRSSTAYFVAGVVQEESPSHMATYVRRGPEEPWMIHEGHSQKKAAPTPSLARFVLFERFPVVPQELEEEDEVPAQEDGDNSELDASPPAPILPSPPPAPSAATTSSGFKDSRKVVADKVPLHMCKHSTSLLLNFASVAALTITAQKVGKATVDRAASIGHIQCDTQRSFPAAAAAQVRSTGFVRQRKVVGARFPRAIDALTVATWNVCSLTVEKVTALRDLKCDICLLQEVWDPSPEALQASWNEGWDIHLLLRDPPSARGGVGVAVRRAVLASMVTHRITSSVNQALGVEVSGADGTILSVISVYAPPGGPGQEFKNFLLLLPTADIIGGDFNATHTSWCPKVELAAASAGTPEPASKSSRRGAALLRYCLSSAMEVLGSLPSHKLGAGLDLLVVRRGAPPFPAGAPTLGTPALSDHLAVVLKLQLDCPPDIRRPSGINWRASTEQQLAGYADLAEPILAGCKPGWSADRQDRFISAVLTRTAKDCLPARSTQIKLSWSDALQTLSRQCTQARTKARAANTTPELKAAATVAFKVLKAAAIEQSSLAKADYMARWKTGRGLWEIWKEAPGTARTPFTHEGQTWRTPLQKATGMCKLFAEKQSPWSGDLHDFVCVPNPPAVPGISLVEVAAAIADHTPSGMPDVARMTSFHLLKLGCHNTPTSKGLTNQATRFLAALAALFTRVLDTGEYPRQWSYGTNHPLYKKGLVSVGTNYRPVTALSILLRTFERILRCRMEWLHAPSPSQFAYQRKRSSEENIQELALFVSDALTQGSLTPIAERAQVAQDRGSLGAAGRRDRVIVCAFDLTDAFCKFTSSLLGHEYRKRKCPEAYLNFIMKNLTGRTISVIMDGRTSRPKRVFRGGAQGGVRTPDEFSVYIDPLLVAEKKAGVINTGNKKMQSAFADDFTVAVTGTSNVRQLLEEATGIVKRVHLWCVGHGLDLSPKTFIRLVGGDADDDAFLLTMPPIMMGNIALKASSEPFAIVGMHWPVAQHASRMVDAMQDSICHIQGLTSIIPPHALRQLYIGQTIGSISYGLHVYWPLLSLEWRNKMEALHMEAAKAIFCIPSTARGSACLAEAGMRTLDYYATRKAILAVEKSRRLPGKGGASGLAIRSRPPRPTSRSRPVRPSDSCRTLAALFPVPSLQSRPVEQLVEPRILPELLAFWNRVTILPLPSQNILRTDLKSVKRTYNDKKIAEASCATHIFTDGSSVTDEEHPLSTGAAAAHLVKDSVLLKESLRNVGEPASSFTAEQVGVELGIDLANDSPEMEFTFFCDTQSNLSMLWRGPLRQHTAAGVILWTKLLELAKRKTHITMVFFFAHCDHTAGDAIDTAAERAHAVAVTPIPVSFMEISRVRLSLVKASHDKEQARIGGFRTQYHAQMCAPLGSLPGQHQKWLAQLRVGCCPLLGGIKEEAPEDCYNCGGMGALGRSGTATEHLFSCPVLLATRGTFGITSCLDMWNKPAATIAYFLRFLGDRRPPVAPNPAFL